MGQEKHVFTIDWAGRQLTVEAGQLAKQANGAVMVATAILQCSAQQPHQKNRNR